MLINFNSLDFCMVLLTIISTCCFLLFTCCNKKKARPNPKRGAGAPHTVNTNMNQMPSGEGPPSKKRAMPKDASQKMGKSPTKPSLQQNKPASIKSSQVKKAPVPNSQPAMLPKKKNQAEPELSSPAVVADSEAYMGPSARGVEVPETIEHEDDDSTPVKEQNEEKEQQTDLLGDQIEGMLTTIKKQKKVLGAKPSTSNMAQQTSTGMRVPAVHHHHRHHGSKQSNLIEIVRMADKGQQTSARIKSKESPLPSTDKRSKEMLGATSRRAIPPPDDKKRKEMPGTASRRATPPLNDKKRKEMPGTASRRAIPPPNDKKRKKKSGTASRRAKPPPGTESQIANQSKRALEEKQEGEPAGRELNSTNVDAEKKRAKEDSKSSEEESSEESEEE